jgi:hypothetical protein
VEITSACLQFDGIKFDHRGGSCNFRIKRPADYRELALTKPMPVFNLPAVGLTGLINYSYILLI